MPLFQAGDTWGKQSTTALSAQLWNIKRGLFIFLQNFGPFYQHPHLSACFTSPLGLEVFQLPLPCLTRVDLKDNCNHLHLQDRTHMDQHECSKKKKN